MVVDYLRLSKEGFSRKILKTNSLLLHMPEKITKDVYKIPGNSNVYIILKPEVFIIDASDRVDSEYIKTEIEKVIPLEEVKKVLLTHLHYDHCGNTDLFPNAQVYASKIELENFKQSPDDFFVHDISEKTREMILNAKELPNEILGLKVINVPGHTRGSVAFLDEKRKILFSGDTLFHNGVGRTDFKNSVPEEMKESVDKLIKLVRNDGYMLCSGHNY